jgi:hypothetical protein
MFCFVLFCFNISFSVGGSSLWASGRGYTFSSGERYLKQWHGVSLEDMTSNLSALAAAASGIYDNGMELI